MKSLRQNLIQFMTFFKTVLLSFLIFFFFYYFRSVKKDKTDQPNDSHRGGERPTQCPDHWRFYQYWLHSAHTGIA